MPADLNNNDNNSQNPFTPFTPADDIKDVNNSNPIDNIPASTTEAEEPQNYPQDERIVAYLLEQVIPTKDPNLTAENVVKEKDRLYQLLENGIFDTAYSQLDDVHKAELDTLMKYGADIPAIQTFFIEKIPNIQIQLSKYMEEFVEKYLKGEI